jgi:peptidoglycan/xylan/chitin deacetylase (PgdA/CDA1 family)
MTCSLRLNLPATGDLPLGTRHQRLEAFARLKSHIRSLDHYAAMSLVDTVLQELNVIPQTSGLLLSWSEARFLNEDGCYLGTHTRQHSCLSRIPINDARQDIRAGKQDQIAEIGTTWPIFSYPYGESCDLSDYLNPILKEEGVKLAVTTIPGINDWSQIDLLRIKRICPSSYHTMAEFQFSLTKIFNLYTAIRGHSFRFPGKNGHTIYLPH